MKRYALDTTQGEIFELGHGAFYSVDDVDAELANLRADLDQARRDRNSAVECAEVLRGYVAEHKAELAKLRAERAIHLASIAEHSKQLAAARAALDGERERALTEAANDLDDHADTLRLAREDGAFIAGVRSSIAALRSRAAEAKASRGGEGKPCPDCKGSGVRVRYHGGSIGNPGVIGLAMESYPCWCQATAQEPKP